MGDSLLNVEHRESQPSIRSQSVRRPKANGTKKLRVAAFLKQIRGLQHNQIGAQTVSTSMISVLPYCTHVFCDGMYASTTKVGLGGLPWPSHRRLSQAIAISYIGTSDMSATIKMGRVTANLCFKSCKHLIADNSQFPS